MARNGGAVYGFATEYGHEQLRFLQDRDRVTAAVLGAGAAGIRFVRR